MSQEVTVKIHTVKLKSLVHNEANPRLIKTKQHQELIKSLKEFPEMKLIREIVVDENMLILAGDKRVYALDELGYDDIAVKQVFGLSEKKKREFIAKDNVHNGEWDSEVIANQWSVEELADWGVPVFKMPGEEEQKKEKAKKDRPVTCPNCHETFDLSEAE